MKSYTIFGVRIDDVSTDELSEILALWLNENTPKTIVTPNPEIIVKTFCDTDFRTILNQSDLSLADGVGLNFGVTLLTDGKLTHRQTGVDTLVLLAKCCENFHKRLLLLGGEDSVADLAEVKLKKLFQVLDVRALNPGFVTNKLSSEVIDRILQIAPDVIAVALGSGKQERVIHELNGMIPTLKISIGVGGAFDMLSGKIRRAPNWFRRIGCEWLWRLCMEPKRLARILRAIIIFPLAVISAKLKIRYHL